MTASAPPHRRTAHPRVPFRVAAFDALCQERGWTTNAQRGEGLGFSEAYISRLRRGLLSPCAEFIDAALSEFRVPYPLLFGREEG